VREVAEKLGLAPGKLYYHFNLLEKHGLVQVAETRQVGNLLEKAYRAAASELEVEKSLLTFSETAELEDMYALMVSTLETTRDDLLRSLQARQSALLQGAVPQPRRMIVNRTLANLSEAQAVELQEKMGSLIQEFTAAEQTEAASSDSQHLYALAVAFYPTFYYPPETGLPGDAEAST
jgi:AcrR family transcriptional regulator